MKTQTTSILLCALLATTFAHDWFQGQQIAHHARSNRHSHLQNRASVPNTPDETCRWICTSDNSTTTNTTTDLKLLINSTTNIVVIVNTTAEVALIIDINAKLVGVFDGKTGASVVIDIVSLVGVYISETDSSTLTWKTSRETIEVYLSKLVSLRIILNSSIGLHFTVSTATTIVLNFVAKILISLSSEFAVVLRSSSKTALTLLIKVSTSLVFILGGSLNGVFKLVDKLVIVLAGDLTWLVSVLDGLGDVISNIKGGLQALIIAKVKLDLQIILGAKNGVEALINILLQIGAKLDLGIVFGHFLNSPEYLLRLIVKLGGNQSSGVNGIFKIILNLILLANGNGKLEELIDILLVYAVSAHVAIDINLHISGLLEVIKIQNSTYNNSQSLIGFFNFLISIRDRTLIVGAIHISQIINVLVIGAVNGSLRLVIAVLVLLSGFVSLSVAISVLVLRLILLLNYSWGIILIQQLIVGLKISVSGGIEGDFLVQILQGFSLIQLAAGLLGGLYGLLIALPVVGTIVKEVSVSLSAATNGSADLKVILNGSGSFVTQIYTIITTIIKTGHSVSIGETSNTTSSTGGGATIGVTSGPTSSTAGSGGGSWTIGIGGGGSWGGSGSISTNSSGSTNTTSGTGGSWSWGK